MEKGYEIWYMECKEVCIGQVHLDNSSQGINKEYIRFIGCTGSARWEKWAR